MVTRHRTRFSSWSAFSSDTRARRPGPCPVDTNCLRLRQTQPGGSRSPVPRRLHPPARAASRSARPVPHPRAFGPLLQLPLDGLQTGKAQTRLATKCPPSSDWPALLSPAVWPSGFPNDNRPPPSGRLRSTSSLRQVLWCLPPPRFHSLQCSCVPIPPDGFPVKSRNHKSPLISLRGEKRIGEDRESAKPRYAREKPICCRSTPRRPLPSSTPETLGPIAD
jgi:hypothetical protein